MSETTARHPKGTEARVLLSSVFGPYAQDDEYGSREVVPMEAYHNQITRMQGPFSIRMFHRSFSLMFLYENIDAPCTLLDFPTLERFIEEIRDNEYDIVGISAVLTNVFKVKKMCELIRRHLPSAEIVVGGHVANIEDIGSMVDADHFVTGEGIQWMRRYLGQDEPAPVIHPKVPIGFGTRSMGVRVFARRGEVPALLVPSVGCPMGCNFCATSTMFGGKGKSVNFYETGDELYGVMCGIEEELKVRDFFVQDENFLLHRERVLRLLELMEENGKSWSFYIFCSANVLKTYTVDQLVRLGVVYVWLGLEGKDARYSKLKGIDTKAMVRELQSHGIMFVASTMIGLEEHTNENMQGIIDWAVEHEADLHQFMLCHAIPGTPLYKEMAEEGRLYSEDEVPWPDFHGLVRFNYRHPHIRNGEESEYLLRAFRQDFEVNGPSISRSIRTILRGWLRYKDHLDGRIRDRYRWWARYLWSVHAGGVWAMRKWFRGDEHLFIKMDTLLRDLYDEFGLKCRLLAPIIGRILFMTLRREDRRLSRGVTYEPRTFYETHGPR